MILFSEFYNLVNSFNLQFYKLHGLKAILTHMWFEYQIIIIKLEKLMQPCPK